MKEHLKTTALLIALLSVAGAAWAIPPVTGSYEEYFDSCEDPDFFPLYWCESLSSYICEAGYIQVDWKEFYDQNGDFKKYWEKVKFDSIVYEVGNPVNNVAYNPLSYTYTFLPSTGDVIFTGLFAQITLPGYGNILRDAGRIVFNEGEIVFEAGDHDFWNEEWDAVCDYLMNGD